MIGLAERVNPLEEGIARADEALAARIRCAFPGIIQSFDPAAMTCQVQPAIQEVATNQDGTTRTITLPLLLDCPVVFPGGGGLTLTFPLANGDECLVVCGDRCIDAWWQSGNVQPQAEFRMHNLSDGFVLPGVRSQPRKLSSVSTTAAELRSDDGLTKLSMGAGVVSIVAPGGVTINGVTFATGGLVTTAGDVTAGLISLKTHKHLGVTTGGGTSGTPTP